VIVVEKSQLSRANTNCGRQSGIDGSDSRSRAREKSSRRSSAIENNVTRVTRCEKKCTSVRSFSKDSRDL